MMAAIVVVAGVILMAYHPLGGAGFVILGWALWTQEKRLLRRVPWYVVLAMAFLMAFFVAAGLVQP